MKRIAEALEKIADTIDSSSTEKKDVQTLKESEDELIEQMTEYAKKYKTEDQFIDSLELSESFLDSIGYDSDLLDIPSQRKMDIVENAVDMNIREFFREKEKEDIEEQKAKLPEAIEKCKRWAEENGLKKLTKSDIGLFISENEYDFNYAVKDLLYGKVNFELKKK